MKKPTELTVEILKGIRTEARKTNARLEETNIRLDSLREHTDAGFHALERRIVESETRTASALTDLAGTVREMTTVLKGQADLRPRVEKCEQEIADIKRQLPRAG